MAWEYLTLNFGKECWYLCISDKRYIFGKDLILHFVHPLVYSRSTHFQRPALFPFSIAGIGMFTYSGGLLRKSRRQLLSIFIFITLFAGTLSPSNMT
jgi:hypothetical protein